MVEVKKLLLKNIGVHSPKVQFNNIINCNKCKAYFKLIYSFAKTYLICVPTGPAETQLREFFMDTEINKGI